MTNLCNIDKLCCHVFPVFIAFTEDLRINSDNKKRDCFQKTTIPKIYVFHSFLFFIFFAKLHFNQPKGYLKKTFYFAEISSHECFIVWSQEGLQLTI
jgi:hypothetical protein